MRAFCRAVEQAVVRQNRHKMSPFPIALTPWCWRTSIWPHSEEHRVRNEAERAELSVRFHSLALQHCGITCLWNQTWIIFIRWNLQKTLWTSWRHRDIWVNSFDCYAVETGQLLIWGLLLLFYWIWQNCWKLHMTVNTSTIITLTHIINNILLGPRRKKCTYKIHLKCNWH